MFGSRRRRDLIWAALAAVGIVLLSGDFGGGSIDLLGAVLALDRGRLLGRLHPAQRADRRTLGGARRAGGGDGDLGAAARPGRDRHGRRESWARPRCSRAASAVGLLSSALPYALEIEALRRLPNAVFGVMMSLEPAVAALVGFVALDQGLDWSEAVAIALVVAASAGALRSAATPAPRDG